MILYYFVRADKPKVNIEIPSLIIYSAKCDARFHPVKFCTKHCIFGTSRNWMESEYAPLRFAKSDQFNDFMILILILLLNLNLWFYFFRKLRWLLSVIQVHVVISHISSIFYFTFIVHNYNFPIHEKKKKKK